jgi:hypothetical protein
MEAQAKASTPSPRQRRRPPSLQEQRRRYLWMLDNKTYFQRLKRDGRWL